MAVETAKNKIKLSQIVGQKEEVISIDGDVIVNDVKPDVLKVINTNGIVCVYKKEALNGKVKIEGCINTYIIYLADDEEGSIRTINTNLGFAEIIDMENCKEQMTLEDNICLKGFETKILNGRKLHVKALLNVSMKVMSNLEVETVTNIKNDDEDIQILNSNKNILSLVGENTGKTTLKDNINLNEQDKLAEIMKVSCSLVNVETKNSYNKVLIKANANFWVLYSTDDNRINEVNAILPVMGFIDMPNVTDTSKCISKVKLKNLLLRPNNTEENSIYVEADLDLYCKAYEIKEVNLIEDVYSIANDIDLKKNKVNTRVDEFELEGNLSLKEKLTNEDLVYARILGANIIPTIENVSVRDGKVTYEGKLNSEFIVNNENNINNVTIEIPFNYEFSSKDINKNSNIETTVNIIEQRIISADDGPTLEVELEINALIQNDEELDFTQDISVLDTQNLETYSMVIYFVKPGDSLWKIAKQFRSKVEDIARVNGIEDEKKIYPGEQLYIPKSTKNKIAI